MDEWCVKHILNGKIPLTLQTGLCKKNKTSEKEYKKQKCSLQLFEFLAFKM